ncbi:MAG: hypothetical protein CME62_08285 [Halobacteriovoraceae bacterium]|nr:hypothetical protein [Halobacteriovoraceae bacterium]|tara:strand:+ start:4700 stop:5410 length:711 start_codon:yes stop_codon:yes gene_type:complete
MKKFLLIALSFALISCGGDSAKKWVTDLEYETRDHDQAKWIATQFKVNLGDNVLPKITQPLPRDYGVFKTFHANGENYMGVDLNLTSIINLPGGIATLPNGQVVPIDTSGAGIIQIPLKFIKGSAYLSLNNDMTLVGVAAVIKQLDGLDLGEIGVFPVATIKGIDIMAGVFTSDNKEESGLAIFANFGSLWDKSLAYEAEAYIYEPEYVARKRRWKLARKLNRLFKKNQTIDFALE